MLHSNLAVQPVVRFKTDAFLQSSTRRRRCATKIEMLEGRILLTAVSSDQEVSGNLVSAGQQDTYTFSATAGGTIEASAGPTNGVLEMQMDLYNASGTLLKSAAANADNQTITLSATSATTGTYYIVLKSANGNTGGYNFSEASMPGTQVEDAYDSAGGPVSSGQEVSGNLVGQLDAYSFSATAGGTIEASAGPTNGVLEMQMDLYNASGTLLKSAAANADNQTITLSATSATTGTYYIVLKSANGNTGGYNFSETTNAMPGGPGSATGSFVFDAAVQQLHYTYSGAVPGNVNAASLVLTNTSTSQTISPASFSSTGGGDVASYTFPAFAHGLPNGSYQASLNGGSTFNFAVLLGDATLDGQVDSHDFDILAAHYGQTSGVKWTFGDFNYDGTVNALDFNALATDYGKSLSPPSGSAIPTDSANRVSATSLAEQPSNLFGDKPIGAEDALLDDLSVGATM